METQDITKIETSATPLILNRNPIEVLEDAKKAAQALTTVISQKKKPVIMNGEQYLEFEDWQTVGQFYGYMVSTGEAVPVEIDGVKGAKATAKLVNFHSGETLGGAEAYCMRDEPNWKVKPWFQLASMAQTRAGAKALRNRLAWVVVLAGFRPTPAEEIQDMASKADVESTATEVKHWCEVHNCEFFLRGKMKSFAHPIGDTKEWCHEHKDRPGEAASPPVSKPAEQTPQVVATTEQPSEVAPAGGKVKRDATTIKTPGGLFQACYDDFNMSRSDIAKEAGFPSIEHLTGLKPKEYQQIYQTIAAASRRI